MRERFTEDLKAAQRAKDTRSVATIRLILAALKDRDIAARTKDGGADGIDDAEILSMLQTMIKQRRESIKLYEQGGRLDLVDQEAQEIAIIEKFLPEQMSDEQIEEAVSEVLLEQGASSLKDMGAAMAALRDKFAGQMDFGKASAVVKAKLS